MSKFEQMTERECIWALLNICMWEDRFEAWGEYDTTRQKINARLAQIREAK